MTHDHNPLFGQVHYVGGRSTTIKTLHYYLSEIAQNLPLGYSCIKIEAYKQLFKNLSYIRVSEESAAVYRVGFGLRDGVTVVFCALAPKILNVDLL